MIKVGQKDKTFDMYPKPALVVNKFYGLSIGEKVVTRYMGPGVVIHAPVRYKHENGVVKVYRDKALIKLSRKCWNHLEPWEFPFYELTSNSYYSGQ